MFWTLRKKRSFRWVKYRPIFVESGSLTQGQYSPIIRVICTQGLKWYPAWAGIEFWWGCWGLNCAQMAPREPESDFGLHGWIGTLGPKWILLIFGVYTLVRGLHKLQLVNSYPFSHVTWLYKSDITVWEQRSTFLSLQLLSLR